MITMKARKIYVRKFHVQNVEKLKHGYILTLKRYNQITRFYLLKNLSNLNQIAHMVNVSEIKTAIDNFERGLTQQKSENNIKIGNFEQYDFLKRYL